MNGLLNIKNNVRKVDKIHDKVLSKLDPKVWECWYPFGALYRNNWELTTDNRAYKKGFNVTSIILHNMKKQINYWNEHLKKDIDYIHQSNPNMASNSRIKLLKGKYEKYLGSKYLFFYPFYGDTTIEPEEQIKKGIFILIDPMQLNGSFLNSIDIIMEAFKFRNWIILIYVPCNPTSKQKGWEALKKLFKDKGIPIEKDANFISDILKDYFAGKYGFWYYNKDCLMRVKRLARCHTRHKADLFIIHNSDLKINFDDVIDDSINLPFYYKKQYNYSYKDREEECKKEFCPICGKKKPLDRLTCCKPKCRAKYSWSPLNTKSKLREKIKDGYHKSFGGIVLPNDDEDKEKM